MSIDVSVVLNLHAEGLQAHSAVQSLSGVVEHARRLGLSVEAIAVLDSADDLTRRIVDAHSHRFDQILTVNFRDLGDSRNAGVEAASGKFATLLDGDDLWGQTWVSSAFGAAQVDRGAPSIWHPQYLYYFNEHDYAHHSTGDYPRHEANSFFMEMRASEDSEFDRRALLMNNVWTSNSFALRQVYLDYPFERADRSRGFGIEDWSWNIETLWGGIPHRIAPATVHMIRIKDSGSLGAENVRQGLLPHLPDGCRLPWIAKAVTDSTDR